MRTALARVRTYVSKTLRLEVIIELNDIGGEVGGKVAANVFFNHVKWYPFQDHLPTWWPAKIRQTVPSRTLASASTVIAG